MDFLINLTQIYLFINSVGLQNQVQGQNIIFLILLNCRMKFYMYIKLRYVEILSILGII